jgi:predicted secreted protein
MSLPISIAIFITIWFVVLFAVLPIGVKSLHESGETIQEGLDPGAPVAPRLVLKAFWTTVVAAIVFAVVYYFGTKYA